MMEMQRKDVQEMGFGQVEDLLAKVNLSIFSLFNHQSSEKVATYFFKAYVKVEFVYSNHMSIEWTKNW